MRAQLDLFGSAMDLPQAEPATYKPDPDRVRRKLDAVLAELCGADKMPWDRKKKACNLLLFPQMTRALPESEADDYKTRFEGELHRLSQR